MKLEIVELASKVSAPCLISHVCKGARVFGLVLGILGLMFIFGTTAGCAGGGSSGTGLGNAVDASGVLLFASGAPAEGIVVTARTAVSDSEDVSDAEGRYELPLRLEPGGSIDFFFRSESLGIEWERAITDIPEGTVRLTVTWTITEDNRVLPVATEFFDEQGRAL